MWFIAGAGLELVILLLQPPDLWKLHAYLKKKN